MIHGKNLREYHYDIQGLRALSVFSVLIFHINKNFLPGGFIGVDLFFIISGYIVTSVILRAKDKGQYSIKSFYLNRIKRIIPAYVIMLAVTTLIMGILLTPNDFMFFKASLKKALLFQSNSYFAHSGNYFAPNSYELALLHTWSLAVEMQFYLLFPIVFCLKSIKLVKQFLTGFLFVGVFIWLTQEPNPQNYFSLYLRVPEFIIGALTYMYQPANLIKKSGSAYAKYLSVIGLLLILFSLFFITEDTAFPSFVNLLPCIGCVLIISNPNHAINYYLSRPAMVWIGNLSYSLYLWHWPILTSIKYYNQQYELSLFSIALVVLVTFYAAWLSYRYVETSFRKITLRTLIQSGNIALPIVCMALFLVAIYLNKSLVTSLPVQLTRYADPNEICHDSIIKDCMRGALISTKEFLVLGDSHAAQLNYFFDLVGKENNFKARVISSSSCITIPNFDVNRLPAWAQEPCLSQIKIATEYAKKTSTIILAGLWEYHTSSKEFLLALDQFLTDADSSGKKVIILSQIPTFNENMSRIYRFNQLGFKTTITQGKGWIRANNTINELVAHHISAQFVNLTDIRFFDKIPFNRNGTLIYYDNNHLNELGVSQYAASASKILSKII
ncbi:MAG: acyltransferase [Legionella sp.]|nr:MAG: acyltransferase [Legionella sp.]PJD97398.1 MAG: acyltransferase [Legionella sp.]